MRIALMAAAMVGGLASHGHSATITVTGSLANTIDPYESIGDVMLPAFNTALGTLTGATVSTQAFLSESETVQPTGRGPLPASGSFNTVFTARVIHASAGPGYTAPVQTVTASIARTMGYGGDAGTATVQATFSNTFSLSAAAAANDGFPLDVRYTIYANPGAGLSFASGDSSNTRVSGNVSVAYSYDPVGTAVPEPASMAMLGLGLAAITVYRRRPS